MALTNAYATVDQFRQFVGRGVTMSDNTIAPIELALNSASRQIDRATGWLQHGFYKDSTVQTRTFEACDAYGLDVPVGIASTSGLIVKTDLDASGTYETTLTSGTHFTLRPTDAVTDGWPYTQVEIIPSSSAYFPTMSDGRDLVQITAIFGWPAVPVEVTEACLIQANRLFKAADAPFGAAALGDTGIAMRVGRGLHPDAQMLLLPFTKAAVG